MAGTPTKDEADLMAYMVGWRIGAKGGVLSPERANNPDCARGHERGRRAAGEAYRVACLEYNAALSPLRGDTPEGPRR